MTGSFTSTTQSEALPDDFFDIHLYMQPIWTGRRDGIWLYVEQAAASNLERPYRQRVYHLHATSEGPRSDVYELPGDPLRFAGAWRTPERLDEVERDELVERSGCSIFLRRSGDAFEGATRGDGCSSSLAGAAYATSEVTITRDVLTSWDRGFDATGEQVWGATAGAYEFVRLR